MSQMARYDPNAPRRAVNLSLNEDLVAQAKGLTPNLSGTVEALLAGFVERERERLRTEDEALEAVVTAVNAFHEKHGFISDDFSNL